MNLFHNKLPDQTCTHDLRGKSKNNFIFLFYDAMIIICILLHHTDIFFYYPIFVMVF